MSHAHEELERVIATATVGHYSGREARILVEEIKRLRAEVQELRSRPFILDGHRIEPTRTTEQTSEET